MALFFDFKSRSSSCSWMCCAIAAGVRPSTVVFGEWARRRGVRLRCIGRLGQQRARAFESLDRSHKELRKARLMKLSFISCIVVGTNGAPRLLVKGAGGAALDFTADRACAAKLSKPGPHAFTVVADAGPRLAFVVVDGALCDGGGVVGKGWTWLPATLAAVVPGGTVTVGATYAGTILEVRAYARALATSEVVGQHRGWLL